MKSAYIRKRLPALFLCLVILAGLFLMPASGARAATSHSAYNDSGNKNGTVSVDPVYADEACAAVLYNHENGLLTSEANAICQTQEGFIWIGCYSGLFRYDGTTFERIPTSTGVTSVRSLFVDRKNRLWIGTNDNGIILKDGGTYLQWDRTDGLPVDMIYDFAEDPSGLIYVATADGIVLIDQNLELSILDDLRIRDVPIDGFHEGPDGLIYCLTIADDFLTLKNGNIVSYLSHDKNPIEDPSAMLPDPKNPGYLYVASNDGKIYHTSLEAPRAVELTGTFNLGSVQSMEYIDNKLWLLSRNGIGVFDDKGMHFLDNMPMNYSIGHMMTDFEGNLWFTSSRQGVMKIVPTRFIDLFERAGLGERVVNTTCLLDQTLFVGTDSGLVILKNGRPLSRFAIKQAYTASGVELETEDLIEYLRGIRIRSIIRDSQNRLWISTWKGVGLLCYDNGVLTAFTEADGLYSSQVRTVVEREDGSFLVALTGGVNIIQNDRVTGGYSDSAGIHNTETLTVAEGFDGSIILGSDGDGIYIIRNTGITHLGREEGLSSEVIMRIKRDPTREIYWIVTSNSLTYMTKDYKIVTIRNFPYTNNFDIYINKEDEAWVLSSNGLYTLPAESLIAHGKLDPIHFSTAHGLPYFPTSNSYSELTEDGDLYIAGSTGSALINIDEPLTDVSTLKLNVPYIEADGTYVYPDEDGNFTISGSTQKVTIHPYVFNFSLIDPIVTYRLKRFDRSQTTVARSELGPISYTNLPGGSYHFILEVKDAMGHESRTLTAKITKNRAFYEQVWFYILAFTALLLGVFYGIRYYIRKRIRLLEEKHREESERERMHTELNMGAQIQASILPPVDPPKFTRDEFEIYASMDPAKEVGGDFYDFFMVDEDHLCLVIADVSGKGIPAALFMMVSKAVLQSCAMLGRSPAEILTKTNDGISSNNQLDMFVTVWVGILELSTGKLTAANAGHEYPILRGADGPFTLFRDKHGLVIGGMENLRYREYEMQLEPGSKLFVYTDGVPEATNSQEQMFGTQRLLETLNQNPDASPRQLLQNVTTAVEDFVQDAEQFDDMTMLCIKYKGPAKK